MLDLESVRRIATPAGYAQAASGGQWKPYPHLQAINNAIIDTVMGVDDCRILTVSVPPQHGKSELMSKYTPAWLMSLWPDRRVILNSYASDFAASWGAKARNVFASMSETTGLRVSKSLKRSDWWGVEGHRGEMSTGGSSSTTGKGANLFIFDDPYSNHEQASSAVVRETVWNQFLSSAYTRLQQDSAVIIMQTRWHVNDLTGQLHEVCKDQGIPVRKLLLPAINERGEALCPELHSFDKLLRTKALLGSYFWSAMYMGNPIPEGGLFFKHDDINQIVDIEPAKIAKVVRYWDTASSKDGDYTVGVLMADGGDGFVYVLDVVRGQWTASTRDAQIEATMKRDFDQHGLKCEQWIEREGGGAGKTVGEINVMRWAKYGCRVETMSKEKSIRARPLQARTEQKQVRLLRAPWNRAFIDELTQCWSGVHDDQADAASGAYNKLVMQSGPVTWHTGA